MKNQVTVTANKDGLVFTSTGISAKDGKEYGYIRIQSNEMDFSSAVARVISLSALKAISKDAFDMSGIPAGTTLDGKILVKESTIKNPFRANHAPKTEGKDGGILLLNGSPIYRETEFTTDLSAQSVLVKHTSVAAVVSAEQSVKLNS